jgi:hypothetical protein
MADIEFTAFVDKVLTSKESGQNWLLKTSETHRRENRETGEWETTARTFRDVRLSNDSDPDLFESVKEGDRVKIKGFELTIASERDDRTFYNLSVYASSCEPAEAAQQPAKEQGRRTTTPPRGNRR